MAADKTMQMLFLCALSWTLAASKLYSNVSAFEGDIHRHKKVADAIIDQVLKGPARGQVYTRLAEMTDKFGPRFCGTEVLESSIDYMMSRLKDEGMDRVYKEPVTIPRWVRGQEKAAMLKPRRQKLAILGLGFSVATPTDGITAEAIVVKTFDELKERASEAKGKIVVFNQDWHSYGQSVEYRSKGASEAAKVGAVAALIRSATGFSLYTPHTGQQNYEDGVKKIPAACVTVEDAELMWRMSKRGERILLFLYMEAHMLADGVSFNTVAEIRGSEHPEQVVLVSGHLDSWDVGQGALDDGGGAFISWEVLSLVRQLNLRPKRTLRLVMWTCEEMGVVGGQEYFRRHQKEAEDFDIVMESDNGAFTPYGLRFTGSDDATEVMKTLAQTLLARVNATEVLPGAELSDLFQWTDLGVPGGSIMTHNGNYFNYHHTNADTMLALNSKQLDLCAAVWAVTAFTLADMESMLPADRTLKYKPIH